MAIVDGKITCYDCKNAKEVSAFQPAVVKKGCGQCRACRQAEAKRKRPEYAARIREEKKRSYQRNKPTIAARAAERYAADPVRAQGMNLKRYGLTVADYNAILLAQGSACACCSKKANNDGRRLFVDHCHETGEVRGLLCQPCNTAIGLLGDNLEGVKNALSYLQESAKKKLQLIKNI